MVELITLDKNEPVSQHEIDKVEEEIQKIIGKALRCEVAFMPLTLELLNYQIIVTGKQLAYVDCPAMTDYSRIWINIRSTFWQTCQKAGMTQSQILTTLLFHEVGHPILYHNLRQGTREPELWNSAADFVINLLLSNLEIESARPVATKLVDMNIRSIPSDNILLNDEFANMVEEEVYDELLKKKRNVKKYYMSMDDFLKAFGDGSNGQDKNDENDEGEESENKNQVKITEDPEEIDGPMVRITETEFEMSDGKTHKTTHVDFPQPKPRNKKEEEAQKSRQRNTNISRKALENTLMAGVESEALQRFLGKLFEVPIDWESILKDSLLTALQPSCDQSWTKPRTIWLANPFMPYLPNNDVEEIRGTAFFSIDESGSMGDEDIKKAIKIVTDANDKYKSLCIMKHDTEVSRIFHFDEHTELTDDMIRELCNRERCGGTSHQDVFRKINEFLKENPDEIASVFIGCTDLYSDIQGCQDELPLSIPRIWIVNSDYSDPDIKGRIIRLKH
jgi:predicted metal-dependent peptidase